MTKIGPTALYLSPKVSDPMLSFRDGPGDGYVRWKCVWLKGQTTAIASEWIANNPLGREWVEQTITQITDERRRLARYRTAEDAELYGKDAEQIARDRMAEDKP